MIICFDCLTCLFLTLYLSKISRRGVDTTVRGESLVGDIVSDIEDGISRDGGLASGSGSTFRESAVSLIGRIRSKRKTRSSSINSRGTWSVWMWSGGASKSGYG